MNDSPAAATLINHAIALHRRTGLLRPFAAVPAPELHALVELAQRPFDQAHRTLLTEHSTPFPTRLTTPTLTTREQLLAAHLRRTATRQEIADQLHVSINTVRSQLATLYRKLGVNTREAALLRLRDIGLAPDPPDHDR